MSIIKVKTGGITADAITDALIADDVVGTEHLTANEVDTTALGADAVTGAQLADNAVNSEHYTDGSVDTAHIADAQITTAKLSTAVLTGATDIGAAIADADLFLVDDGAGGTLRKTAASRIKTYVGGGITEADTWRITSNFTTQTGVIASNWERVDTYGYDKLGSGMSESSGIFTFPSTGHYLIMFNAYFNDTYAGNYIGAQMQLTQNNSSYNIVTENYGNSPTNGHHVNISMQYHADITNVSNYKIRFNGYSHDSSRFAGSTGLTATGAIFIKLGDT